MNRLFTKVASWVKVCQGGTTNGPSSIAQASRDCRAGRRRVADARPGPADPHRAALFGRRADRYGVTTDRRPHAENARPPRDHRQPPGRGRADRDTLRPVGAPGRGYAALLQLGLRDAADAAEGRNLRPAEG